MRRSTDEAQSCAAMVEQHSKLDLTSKLRESGEAAAYLAGRLRKILDDPQLSDDAAIELLLGINTRCTEIEDLREAVCKSTTSSELTRRVAHQIENLWNDLWAMANAKVSKTQR